MEIPLISLKHVSVARGDREVLHDISLRLNAGEHVAVLGPNGCGKSTLLKVLTCELYPIAGSKTTVQLFGRSRWDVAELRKRLGVVSSDPIPRSMLDISGAEAVLSGFFSSTRIWPNLVITQSMRERAKFLLSRVGGEHLAQKAVGTMSSGEQRKIMIARALAGSCLPDTPSGAADLANAGEPGPGMVLLDEPSNSLDLVAQRVLHGTLRELARTGASVLLITHHVADIIPEIGHVILLRDGRVFREGSREAVLTSDVLSELFQTPIHIVEKEGALVAY